LEKKKPQMDSAKFSLVRQAPNGHAKIGHQTDRAGSRPQNAIKTIPTLTSESKKGICYKPLALKFSKGGFKYRQIAREGDFAIYEQCWRNSLNVAFEVVHIRRIEAGTLPDGNPCPAHEVYLSLRQWGTYGWMVITREAAFNKLRELAGQGASPL
jgi:hypothetical protein